MDIKKVNKQMGNIVSSFAPILLGNYASGRILYPPLVIIENNITMHEIHKIVSPI